MPDDRFFHKRLGHSEKVNSLTDFEYIVWHAYILSADDFGVMRFTSAALCADHDRLDAKPAKLIQKALERVRDVGLIQTFQHQGRPYCYQHDWQEWQRVDYPRRTINPPAPMEGLTEKTRELFAKHPGGFGRRVRGTSGDGSPNGSANVPRTVSGTVAEPFGNRSGEIPPKPLAVSRQPVAISREPLAVVPPAADRRSKHPVFKGQRLTVFDWMEEDLSRLLGRAVADALDVHAWFYELDARVVASGELVPQRDGGKWLQEQTLTECRSRGLLTEPEHKSKLTLALEKASNGW